MLGYERRLRRDLPRWRGAGWVSADGEEAILADVARSGAGINLPAILAILGAVLIGFAAMSFVAANWQEMSKLTRLLLLGSAMWGSYIAAGAFFQRDLDAFGHAATLLGASVFGASIMLIAQMYHMEGNPPDAVLVWAAGTLVAGVLLRSNPALALALVLVCLWSGWETTLLHGVHWPFLLGWGVVAAAFLWQRWWPGLHLSALALSVWIVALGYWLEGGHAHTLVVLVGVMLTGLLFAAPSIEPRMADLARSAMGYPLAITFAGVYALQFVERPELGSLVVLALATLAGTVGVIAYALRTGNRSLLWLAYVGFSIELITLYFKTIGTLMGSAVFFLSAGLGVIALAVIAWRLNMQLSRTTGEVTP